MTAAHAEAPVTKSAPQKTTASFCIASRKGGVGKTTITANTATALASAGYSVLAIDLDPQGNLTEALTGALRHDFTVVDLLAQPTADRTVEGPVASLRVLPSGLARLDEAADLLAAAGAQGHQRLAQAISQAVNARDYDFVLIDTPPTFNTLTMVALASTDFVVSPVDPRSKWSANGSGDVQGYVQKAFESGTGRALFAGVVLNRVPALARKVARAVAEDMAAAGIDVSEATIPDLRHAAEGEYLGKPGYLIDRNTKFAIAFDGLAEEFIALRTLLEQHQKGA